MASIERTAYPVFARSYSPKELKQYFSLEEDELEWVKTKSSSAALRLGLAVLLKCFQQLRYFPPLDEIPSSIVDHIRAFFGYSDRVQLDYAIKNTLYRHMTAVREYLQVTPTYGQAATAAAQEIAYAAAELLDQRVDIINVVIDELVEQRFELPAFRTLDELAERTHTEVQGRIFSTVFSRLSTECLESLSTLLQTDTLQRRQSEYNDLKKSAKRSTRKHLEMLVDHLAWLESLGNMGGVFAGVPETKVRHFAAQAQAFDVSELRECSEPKRYTLMLALIHRMQVRARDQLSEMFLRRVATIHKRAKEELEQIQSKQRGQAERLISTLDQVLAILEREPDNATAGGEIRDYLAPDGGINQLRLSCAQVQATSGNNYLPLVWKHFKSHRAVLFRLVDLLDIAPTSQDTALTDALDVIKTYQDKHRIEWIDEEVELSFASDRWRKLLLQALGQGVGVNRRILEICVFSYLASARRQQLYRGVPALHPAGGLGSHLCHRGAAQGRVECGSGDRARRYAGAVGDGVRVHSPTGHQADAAYPQLEEPDPVSAGQVHQVPAYQPAVRRDGRLGDDREALAGPDAGCTVDLFREDLLRHAATQTRIVQPEEPPVFCGPAVGQCGTDRLLAGVDWQPRAAAGGDRQHQQDRIL